MVANGADGNVRGRMVGSRNGAAVEQPARRATTSSPTRASTPSSAPACTTARSARWRDCDAQGNLSEPISLDDWKRAAIGLGTGNRDVSADYINQRDLNLLRRMVATRSPAGGIAFYVCNHPGPDGTSADARSTR